MLNGRLLDWPQHAARLARNLDELGIAPPLGAAALALVARRLIAANRAREALLYIQVTRGSARRDHGFRRSPAPDAGDDGAPVRFCPACRVSRRAALPSSPLPTSAGGAATSRPPACSPTCSPSRRRGRRGRSRRCWWAPTAASPRALDQRVDRRGRHAGHAAADPRVLPGVMRAAVIAAAGQMGIAVAERPFTCPGAGGGRGADHLDDGAGAAGGADRRGEVAAARRARSRRSWRRRSGNGSPTRPAIGRSGRGRFGSLRRSVMLGCSVHTPAHPLEAILDPRPMARASATKARRSASDSCWKPASIAAWWRALPRPRSAFVVHRPLQRDRVEPLGIEDRQHPVARGLDLGRHRACRHRASRPASPLARLRSFPRTCGLPCQPGPAPALRRRRYLRRRRERHRQGQGRAQGAS